MNNLVRQKWFQKISYWILMLAIFLAYWLISRHYTGPAYLTDEIGYLTKAAAFARHPVDMASSWHGGYSLMLAPLFMAFSDPFVVWQGVMIVNALFWASSFMLLFYLLKRLFPDRGFLAIFFAVAFSSIYPSWVTMSGYAYSTPAFVLVFMLAVIALLSYSHKNLFTIIPYSFLIGYLYWIHPIGLAIVAVSLLFIAGLAWHSKRVSGLLLHFCILAGMVIIYKYVIHAWLSQIMTPENYSVWSHYRSIPDVLKNFIKPEFFIIWLVIFCGHVSYLVISTFGILLFSFSGIYSYYGGSGKISDIDTRTVFLFLLFSLLGILILGSMSFASHLSDNNLLRIDHWIYGRYSETVLLPLIGIGIMSAWRFRLTFFSCLLVLLSGFLLFYFSKETNTIKFNEIQSIPSFWPQALFPENNFLSWFALGALGIAFVSILKKRLFILLVAPLFFVSVSNQISWHSKILFHYSRPSGLVEFIRTNFSYGTCIGFTPEREPRGALPERRQMYSYYFFNYDFRRMSYTYWLNTCDGPYFTYNETPFIENDEVTIIAREENSGLYLAIKKDQLDRISTQGLSMVGVKIDLSGSNYCLIQGCFNMTASDLNRFSQVGDLVDNALVTTGQKGYLFYGPYTSLRAGSYYMSFDMALINPGGSWLDIVHNKGSERILDVDLSNYATNDTGSMTFPFELKNDINDIEVRLHVSDNTFIEVYSYSVMSNDNNIQMPLPEPFLYHAGPANINSQVGVLQEGRLYSNENSGFLAFVPYKPLNAGMYKLIVSGEASNIEQAFVDVVSDKGRTVHAKFMLLENIQEEDGVLLRDVFILKNDVQDIEIRLWASKKDVITLDGYSVGSVQ